MVTGPFLIFSYPNRREIEKEGLIGFICMILYPDIEYVAVKPYICFRSSDWSTNRAVIIFRLTEIPSGYGDMKIKKKLFDY